MGNEVSSETPPKTALVVEAKSPRKESTTKPEVIKSTVYKTNFIKGIRSSSGVAEKDDSNSQVIKSNPYKSRSSNYKTNFNKDILSYSSVVAGKVDSNSQVELNKSDLEGFCPLFSSQTNRLHKGNSSELCISEKSYSVKDSQECRAKSDVCPPLSPTSNKITYMEISSNSQEMEADESLFKVSNARIMSNRKPIKEHVKEKNVYNPFKEEEDSRLQWRELYKGTKPRLFEKAVQGSSGNASSEESEIKDTAHVYGYRDSETDFHVLKNPETKLEYSAKSVRPKIKSTDAPFSSSGQYKGFETNKDKDKTDLVKFEFQHENISDESVRTKTKLTNLSYLPLEPSTDFEKSSKMIEQENFRKSDIKLEKIAEESVPLDTKYTVPLRMSAKPYTDFEASPAISEKNDLSRPTSESKVVKSITKPTRSELKFASTYCPPSEQKTKEIETTTSVANTDTRKTLRAVRKNSGNLFLKSNIDTEVSKLTPEPDNFKEYNLSKTFRDHKTIDAKYGDGNTRNTEEYTKKKPPPKSPHMLKETPSKTTSLLSFSRLGNNKESNSNCTITTTSSKKPPQTTSTSSQTDPQDLECFSSEMEKMVPGEKSVLRMPGKTIADNMRFPKIGKATLIKRDDFRPGKDSAKTEKPATVTRKSLFEKPSPKLFLEFQEDKPPGNTSMRKSLFEKPSPKLFLEFQEDKPTGNTGMRKSLFEKPSPKLLLEFQEDKPTGNTGMRFDEIGKTTLIRKYDFKSGKDSTGTEQPATVTREDSIYKKSAPKLHFDAQEDKPTGPTNDVRNLRARVERLKAKVDEFKGTEANQASRQLEMDLLECGVELDNIDTNGVEEIRKERRDIRMTMQKSLDLLNRKTGSH